MALIFISLISIVISKNLIFEKYQQTRLFSPLRFGLVLFDQDAEPSFLKSQEGIEESEIGSDVIQEMVISNKVDLHDKSDADMKSDLEIENNNQLNVIPADNIMKDPRTEILTVNDPDIIEQNPEFETEINYIINELPKEDANPNQDLFFQINPDLKDTATQSLATKTSEEISENNSFSFVTLSFIASVFIFALLYLHYRFK